MSSRLALFAGAAVGTVVVLRVILTPRMFSLTMRCAAIGIITGGTVTYINHLRHHSMRAQYVPFGLTPPPVNYDKDVRPIIFKDITEDYDTLGQIERGEEALTVKPNVFAQIGVLDVDGVRTMWNAVVVPNVRQHKESVAFADSAVSKAAVEDGIVFCDIGSGVGNICLQVLAETHCTKTVGVEVIPSRVRAAQKAMANAQEYFPELFGNKRAVWLQEDLVESAAALKAENVNVVFTHSWMFDDELMTKLTKVIAEVPSIECVVTSRKLDDKVLAGTALKLATFTHFTADWNDQAPFYVYSKKAEK